MPQKKKPDIKEILNGYCQSFQFDGNPIPVNFRLLVPELKKTERFTHLIHPYPAKLLTNIPYFFFATDALCPYSGTVLDPFCGTGTVLLEALLSGRNALGADANPLAELITAVKTTYIACEDLIETLEVVLKRAKRTKRTMVFPEAVAVWYSPSTLPQLDSLQASISYIKNKKQKAFFELCFSNVVRKVSLADPTISVPVHLNPNRFNDNPNRKKDVEFKLQALKEVDVFDKFDSVCKVNIGRVETLNGKIDTGIKAKIVANDARHLGLQDNSIDMILTSPPYAGAQKYIRASWLNLYWLNRVALEDIKELKKHNIGREDYHKSEISECYTGIEDADSVLRELYDTGYMQRAYLVANYLNEMKEALDESYRVLRNGGHMVMVIGNNTVCNHMFDTQHYLTTYLERKGMQLRFKLIDDIKSYGLMTKRNKTADKISREWILVFKK